MGINSYNRIIIDDDLPKLPPMVLQAYKEQRLIVFYWCRYFQTHGVHGLGSDGEQTDRCHLHASSG